MSIKEQRRQKKLAKKKSKDIAKRKDLARTKNAMHSLAGQFQAASKGPVDECLVSDGIFRAGQGLGSVMISRRMKDGRVAIAKFLIDALCLGVKDIATFVLFPADQKDLLSQVREPMRRSTPERARKIVESAIAFAAQFDLQPHADYAKVQAIWDGINADECTEIFHFGENGKPHFINGPFDSGPFQTRVLRKLELHAGKGNYSFLFMSDGTNAPPRDFIEDARGDLAIEDESDPSLDNVVDGHVIQTE